MIVDLRRNIKNKFIWILKENNYYGYNGKYYVQLLEYGDGTYHFDKSVLPFLYETWDYWPKVNLNIKTIKWHKSYSECGVENCVPCIELKDFLNDC